MYHPHLPPNGRSAEGSPRISAIKCPFIVYRDKQLRKLSYIGNQWSRIAAQSSINQSTCTHAYTHVAIVVSAQYLIPNTVRLSNSHLDYSNLFFTSLAMCEGKLVLQPPERVQPKSIEQTRDA